jgi:hypothetical protein
MATEVISPDIERRKRILTGIIRLEPSAVSWSQAQQLARSQGGHLATLTSAAENDFVFGLVSSPEFWYLNEFGPFVLERLPLSSSLRVSEVELCWETVGTKVYQPQYRSVLTANTWTALGPLIPGNGETSCIKDTVPADEPQRFYRVVMVP